MNTPASNSSATNQPVSDQWGERISAYLDGELSPSEASVVQQRLADDPACRQYAEELRSIHRTFASAQAPVFQNDLASGVVAEALRRQATGEGMKELPDRLEPEGDFGLPFGKSPRSWAWLGVAAAATILIGFYGRPDRPSSVDSPGGGPGIAATRAGEPTQFDRNLVAMQRMVPNLRVKNYQVTPAQLGRLQQALAMQSGQQAKLPGELMNVSQQKGVTFGPADPGSIASGDATDQLVYIDADEAELDRLLAEVDDDSLVQVAPNQRPQVAAKAKAKSNVRAIPLRLNISPEVLAKLVAQQKQAPAEAGGRRVIVLRIHVKKPTP